MDSDTIKMALDIGLGAASILLWLKQDKVNQQQVLLDEKQNEATRDLTTMVKDHEQRIERLENTSVTKRSMNKKISDVRKRLDTP